MWCGGHQKELKGEDCLQTFDTSIAGERVFFTLVADGHGGKEAAAYAAQGLLPMIAEKAVKGDGESLHAAVVECFRSLHEDICASGTHSGSTLTVCCINASRHEIGVWNVGDSLAVLVDADGHAILGTSHRLEDNKDEQERVTRLGARLGRAMTDEGKQGGPLRAWPGGLAVTRTVGDADCRSFVIPEPAWSTCPSPPNGGALLACSDGVWDHCSPGEAATVLLDGQYDSAGNAAQQVVRKSTRRGLTDDTSAVVMLFGPAPIGGDDSGDWDAEQEEDGEDEAAEAPSPRVSKGESEARKRRSNSFLNRVGKVPMETGDASPLEGSTSAPAPDGASEDEKLERLSGSTKLSRGTGTAKLTVHTGGLSDREAEPAPRRPGPPAATRPGPAAVEERSSSGSGKGSSPAGRPPTLQETGARGTGSGGNSTNRSRGARLSMIFDSFVHSPKGLVQSPSFNRRASLTGLPQRTEVDDSGKSPSPPWAGKNTSGFSPAHSRRHRSASDTSNRFSLRTSDGVSTPSPGHSGHNQSNLSGEGSGHFGSLFAESCWRGITRDGDPKPGTRVADWSQLTSFKYLGEGEFATAHQTTLDGNEVAIKMLKRSKQDEPAAVQGLKREIMLMTLMDHPNVLTAFALGQHEGKPLMIIQLLGCTLTSQLPRDPDTVPFWVRWREVKRWPISRCMHCAVQLAKALKYCHDDAFPGYRILHRDVKPNNIGFLAAAHHGADHLVLFDFGLASLWERRGGDQDDAPRDLTGETGSLRYMAPEVANSQPYNPRCEVFSFATVLYEITSHKRPFGGLSPNVFKKAIGSGFLPTVPKKWPEELKALLADCWQMDPAKRPEFNQIVPRLDALCAEFPLAQPK